MWTAINTENGEQIVSISQKWADKRDVLHSLHRRNFLICDECRQSVLFRGGTKRRWHFAHKQITDCPRDNESPELSLARALLFERLEKEYGNRVSLEQRIDESDLPRRVDCWIDSEDGGSIAYWILDRQIRRVDERDALRTSFEKLSATVHWLFLSDMERPYEEESDALFMSPTQREFMVSTRFDPSIIEGLLRHGWSLYFIDPKDQSLITYRGLHLFHESQGFRGRREASLIADTAITKLTGDLHHASEQAAVLTLRREWSQIQKERRSALRSQNFSRLETLREKIREEREYERQSQRDIERRVQQIQEEQVRGNAPAPIPISSTRVVSFRVTEQAQIDEIRRLREPRTIRFGSNVVETILTDEEAVAVCCLFHDEPYLLNVFNKSKKHHSLGVLTGMEIISAHERVMKFVARLGIAEVEKIHKKVATEF